MLSTQNQMRQSQNHALGSLEAEPMTNSLSEEEKLWLHVLKVALEDLRCAQEDRKRNAKAWLLSRRQNIGSYRWICFIFNTNPKECLRKLREEGLL